MKLAGASVLMTIPPLLLLLLQVVRAAAPPMLAPVPPCYPALFIFGDSLSDTGNGVLSGNSLAVRTTQRPYGETDPGTPFDRFSDGLLLVDFLAARIRLPLSSPSLNASADLSTGANYAVVGATAQDYTVLVSRGIFPVTNLSLDVQLDWHLALKASGPGPKKPGPIAFSNGLYVIEIGGNDYMAALNSRIYSPSYLDTNFIPLVMAKIKNATQVLYASGARNFLYISITPLGCSPSILASFPYAAKDSNGCLRDANTLSFDHGTSLAALVASLRSTYTDAKFVLVDYYGSYTQVISNSASYGFSDTLDACCGASGLPYRYNLAQFCSVYSTQFAGDLCSNPNIFLNWDGFHFTNKFNLVIFNLTIGSGTYLNPSNAFSTCIAG